MSGPAGVIRVMIVDDHAVVRAGIRHVLTADQRFAVIAEAGDAESAIAQARTGCPDVVMLDITLPGMSGLDAVPLVRAAAPAARVLMLSVHDDAEYVMRSVRAGAHGYLRKDTTPADLRAAVHAVQAGGGFFSPTVAGQLTAAIRAETLAADRTPRAASLESLTSREREVLALVARGLLHKEIAAELGISVRTVEAHRDNLARKLGIRSTAGLTRVAIESGMNVSSGDPP